MGTCQSSELGWEVTVELPADFLSLGRGSVTPPPRILRRSHGFPPGVAGVKLVLADKVMGAVPSPDLLRP